MGTVVHFVYVDSLGGRVAPRPQDPLMESALVEIVKFLGRAAQAAGRAVGQPEPSLRLTWRWGQIDVKPTREGFFGVAVMEVPDRPPTAGRQEAGVLA